MSWITKKIGEIGKVSMCKRILKNQTSVVGDIPFYKIGTFGKIADAYISKEIYDEYVGKYSFPKKGDILLSASGTIGRRVIYDGKPAYFQDSNIVWIANDEREVLNEYLYKFYGYCNWNPSKGATISRLYNDDLRNIIISFPKSLEEQQTIVAKLDQAFAAIDQAKANIEKNIANAKELFQSKLNQIFSQKGDGWEENKLGEVVQFTNGRNQKEVLDVNGEYPILGSAGNIMGYATNFLCEIGTVIIGRKGNISKPLFIDFKFWNVDTAFGLFPKNKIMLPKFNYYLCLNIDFASHNKGTTIPSLVKSDLIEIKVSYPISLEIQQKIVTQLDQLQEQTNLLVTKYQQKLANLEELKKSILEKAFKGELV